MGAYWSAYLSVYWSGNRKRNPDEAEEDDIGPITDDMSYPEQRKSQLTKKLRMYYKEYAAIPVDKRKEAETVVGEFKRSLEDEIKSSKYDFDDVMPQGSSYEGLKVIEPNEFDLLLPLKLKDNLWSHTREAAEKGTGKTIEAPKGYFFIFRTKVQNDTDTCSYDDAIFNSVYLNPIKIKQNLQSSVQKAINKMNSLKEEGKKYPKYKINRGSSPGPALTVGVWYGDVGQEFMNIDIVLSVKINDRLFVAKKHPDADYESDENMHNYIWRESYSEKEKEIIREMDRRYDCRRACLKILKTIRERKKKKKTYQLKEVLNSYHLKTCMLHLNADENIGPWYQDNLDYRFKDLLRKLRDYTENEFMPSFHDPEVNVFSSIKSPQLRGISKSLSEILDSDELIIDEMLS